MTALSFTEGPAPALPRRAPQDYCKSNKPGSGFRAGVVSRSSTMPNDVQAAIVNSPKPEALYGKLEDRILARDQKGASEVYYDLVRQRRPMQEIIGEAVRIHAPYTHVPYHERIDDGYVNFVNNDHCLLSARAAINLARLVPEDCAALPLAQTIWYIPTGLDIWNQKILKAPGHYARAPGWSMPPGPPPKPEVVWPDQQPERLDGPLDERLNHWMTLVHRGNVLEAYRVFLGLMENPAERRQVLAQLCHAGLMDVQDRPLQPLLYDRPQGVPRPRHGRARQFPRLGQRPRRR